MDYQCIKRSLGLRCQHGCLFIMIPLLCFHQGILPASAPQYLLVKTLKDVDERDPATFGKMLSGEEKERARARLAKLKWRELRTFGGRLVRDGGCRASEQDKETQRWMTFTGSEFRVGSKDLLLDEIYDHGNGELVLFLKARFASAYFVYSSTGNAESALARFQPLGTRKFELEVPECCLEIPRDGDFDGAWSQRYPLVEYDCRPLTPAQEKIRAATGGFEQKLTPVGFSRDGRFFAFVDHDDLCKPPPQHAEGGVVCDQPIRATLRIVDVSKNRYFGRAIESKTADARRNAYDDVLSSAAPQLKACGIVKYLLGEQLRLDTITSQFAFDPGGEPSYLKLLPVLSTTAGCPGQPAALQFLLIGRRSGSVLVLQQDSAIIPAWRRCATDYLIWSVWKLKTPSGISLAVQLRVQNADRENMIVTALQPVPAEIH